jgi:hypothetical protein
MTPHQANLFFIAEYVLTILILAFSAYRKNAFDWRKTIRRKTFIKRMLFLIPVALIAIGIMTAAYLLQLPQMTTLVIITGAQLFLTLIANVILFSSWFQRYRVYPRGKELAVADLFMPSGIKYGVLVVGILVGCLLPDSWKVDD